jgi:hypothetical protein
MRKKVNLANQALQRAALKEQKLKNLQERLIKEQKEKLFELEQKYNSALKEVQKALKSVENPDARRLLNKAHKIKSEAKVKEEKKVLNFNDGQKVKYRGSVGVILS